MTKTKKKHKNKTRRITIQRDDVEGENMWKSMTPENKLLSLSIV